VAFVLDKNLIVHNKHILILMIISFSMITFLSFLFGLLNAREDQEIFRSFITDEMKSFIKSEVTNRYNQLDYDLKRIENEDRQRIKERMNDIYLIYHTLFAEEFKMEDPRQVLLNGLMTIDDIDTEEVFYMLTPEGVFIRSPLDSLPMGIDCNDMEELTDRSLLNDFLSCVGLEEGVFCTYDLSVKEDERPKRMTFYSRYFPCCDVIVVVGRCGEDINNRLKSETYNSIQNYYEQEELYMFIFDFDANILVHSDTQLIGENFYEINNSEGIFAHEAIMELLNEADEGFVEYRFNKKNSSVISKKVAYVKKIADWDVYTGMGFYIDDIDAEVRRQSEIFLRGQLIEMLLLLMIFLITTLILIFMIRKRLKLQKQQIKEDEVVFTELFQTSNEGLVIVNLKGIVLYSNEKAKNLFRDKCNESFTSDGHLNGKKISEEIMELPLNEVEKRYVNYQCREFNYLNQNVFIYYLSDITEDYLSMTDLKAQALKDPLTGLSNRRKFNEDVAKYMNDIHSGKFLCIALLDIDHFKKVNDSFGHEKGDDILKLFADCFTNGLRPQDRLYRYGGEEFILVLRDVEVVKAINIINRIKIEFGERSSEITGYSVTFSAGLVKPFDVSRYSSVSELIQKCDELLYLAKSNGRNRIEINL